MDEEEKLIRSIGDLEHMRKSLRHQKLDEEDMGGSARGTKYNRRPIREDYVYRMQDQIAEIGDSDALMSGDHEARQVSMKLF